jgi:hypothetical protein
MPLSVGDKLGHSLLGKGGLGGVYRVRDTKLKRDGPVGKDEPNKTSREGIWFVRLLSDGVWPNKARRPSRSRQRPKRIILR